METNLNMINITQKSLESFAEEMESFVTSMTGINKEIANKNMCNLVNWGLRYGPRDENSESICEDISGHYQCDCTDPKNYNFENEGRF